MAPKQTKAVSITACSPKNHENCFQSKLIRSILFFLNRRVFLNPTEILKRKLIFIICVLTRENNPCLNDGSREMNSPCAAPMWLSSTTININDLP